MSVLEPEGLPAETVPVSEALALRHNRNFRLLWIGQILSDLGTNVGGIAYPFLVLYLTGSPVLAGLVGTLSAIAAFLVRLPAGSLADRVDRRTAMIATDTMRTAALALLAALVAVNWVDWEVLLVVAIFDRVGDTMFTPASMAALPAIVHDTQLESAWAATEGRQYTASLAGPALGGVLYNLGRSLPFVGDAISYGVSVVTSSAMRGEFAPPPVEGPRPGLWRDAFEGIAYVRRSALLRAVMVLSPLINFAINGVFFAIIVGMRTSGKSSWVIGLTQAAIMAGGLLGAILAPRIQGRYSMRVLVVIVTLPGTALLAVAGMLEPSPLLALPMGALLLLAPTLNAALIAAMLRASPPEMRGRVTNSLMQVATGLATISPLIAGVLIKETSANWAIGAFAVVLGISAVFALFMRGLRETPDSLGGPATDGDPGEPGSGVDDAVATEGTVGSDQ